MSTKNTPETTRLELFDLLAGPLDRLVIVQHRGFEVSLERRSVFVTAPDGGRQYSFHLPSGYEPIIAVLDLIGDIDRLIDILQGVPRG